MTETAATLDARARARATDPTLSVLLEAPAGSGKTAVLTQRFLRLLTRVDEPGEILAITFTRKAAAEMRARVMRALREELPAEDPNAAQLRVLAAAARAHAAARGFDLARDAALLRIQTIDSFNFALASELPLASRAGAALAVTELAEGFYARAARRTLYAAETEPQLQEHAQCLFERLDNNWMNLERLLAQLLAERSHWLPFVLAQAPEALVRRVNASLAHLALRHLAALSALTTPALRSAAEALPGVGRLDAGPAALEAWRRLAQLTLTKEDWRRQLAARHLGPHFTEPARREQLRTLIGQLQGVRGLREALLALRAAPEAALHDEDATAIASLSRLLTRAAAELYAEFAERAEVDHTYVTGAARAALSCGGEPTDLALRTGLRLKHILVDEFQDTSLAQFELIEMLTAGWEALEGRTLFVVGDPMQSIYRFRDAEVSLFLKARAAGIGGVRLEPLRLVRNFRAAAALVEFTNALFTQVFPAADDPALGAVAYHASSAGRTAEQSGAQEQVSLRLFPGERLAEARALAAHAAALRARFPQASIAVLVSAHAHAVPIVAALQAAGLTALGVDLVPLGERAVVRDLVALATALHDLADRTAWLAVLRAPWCGARLATLAALSVADDPQLVFEALHDARRLGECAPEERRRLERVRGVLAEALATRGEAPPAQWLLRTWLALGASDAYAESELEDARAFFAALTERAAAGDWSGPADFVPLLARLFSAGGAQDSAPVQVMTIHRAKGLEFDHVLLPALERLPQGAKLRLWRWADQPGEGREGELLIAPATAVGQREPSRLDTYLRALLRAREAQERRRLLYVAITRARESLWLSGAPAAAADGSVRPDARSLLGILWEALGARFAIAPAAPLPAGTARSPSLTRLVAGYERAALPPALPLTRLPRAHLPLELPEFSWVGETQRHIGTVVHDRLARLAAQSELPPPGHPVATIEAVRAQLARAGVPGEECAVAAERVLAALAQTLADPRGRWILDASHREAASELALSGLSAGRLRTIRIDRCFVDAAGTRWVIDFKTSRHEGGGLEAFLDEEVERYRAQLRTYRELAQGLGPQPVRTALYFPLLAAFREVEP